jgi:hypothetical protein
MAHAAGDEETVALFPDIQVGNQGVELKGVNLEERIGNALSDVHVEASFVQNRGQSEADTGFVVNKQQAFARLVFGHGSLRHLFTPVMSV